MDCQESRTNEDNHKGGMEYSNKQIEKLIRNIYNGDVSTGSLPEDLYFAIAKYLEKGMLKGIKEGKIEFSGSQKELVAELRENIYLFSGAKTYQSVRAMESMLTENGELRSFKDFKEVARQEYDLYNVTWAQAEYDTAIAQAQNAYAWNEFEKDKDVLPLLRYSAVLDENTSDICEPLDGITLPVDDPFWDKYMPPNHYNCRCLVEQLDEGNVTSEDEVKGRSETAKEEMDDVFKMNPGKTKEIYDSRHPYFTEIPDEDRDWAKENFGLPLPEND